MNLTRILIIHREGNAANNPSLKAMFDFFGECGCQCDILSQKRGVSQSDSPYLHWLFDGEIVRQIKAISINVLCIGWISRMIVRWQWGRRPTRRYRLIIGVDRQGLIEAYYLSRLMRIPYYFISFEIMFEKETFQRFKRLEREASQSVSAWIVQDRLRAEKLVLENNLDLSKVFYLPVASRGLGEFGQNRLRDKLGIPKDMHVIIAIGSIDTWTMIDTILESLPFWPEDWALIVHERYGSTKKQLGNLTKRGIVTGHRLFLSEGAVKHVDEMAEILNGIRYGLAFYRPVPGHRYWGDNLKYLGRASGKIATYFRYGIPVITNVSGEMADDIHAFGLGHVIDSPGDIPRVLQKCVMDPDEAYRKCQQYFINNLDFNLYAEELASRLNIKSRGPFKNQEAPK